MRCQLSTPYAFVACFFVASSLDGQVIEQCDTCRAGIQFERSVGGSSLPLSDGSRLARDRSGRIYASHAPEPGLVSLLRPSGEVERSLGRLGLGPGEFTRSVIQLHAVAGDSVVAMNGTRLTVLSPGAASVVSSRTIATHAYYWFPLTAESLVVQAPIAGQGLVHLIAGTGRIERSIAAKLPFASEVDPFDRVLVIAPARSGGLWASRVNAFSPARLSLDGDTLARISPVRHWFQPWAGYDRDRPLFRPPQSQVDQLHEYPTGTLWVMFLVADRAWRAQATTRREVPTSEIDWSKVWDTVIEAWDITRGLRLGSVRFEGQGLGFIGDRSLYVRRTDASGELVFDVYQLTLHDRTREER